MDQLHSWAAVTAPDTSAGPHRKATMPHYQSKKQHEGAYKNEKTVF
nr:MAG TPA: hypothetical protein [Caudoviricetes sp.]